MADVDKHFETWYKEEESLLGKINQTNIKSLHDAFKKKIEFWSKTGRTVKYQYARNVFDKNTPALATFFEKQSEMFSSDHDLMEKVSMDF